MLGGAVATQVIGPSSVLAATSSKRPIIGIPAPYKVTQTSDTFVASFFGGLQDLGYVVDRDLDLQFRLADGDLDRWPAVVQEVVQLKPDVIFAFANHGGGCCEEGDIDDPHCLRGSRRRGLPWPD